MTFVRRFTEAEDDLLRKLWRTRIEDKIIADRMGRHRGVIRRRAADIGLPKSRRAMWSAEERV